MADYRHQYGSYDSRGLGDENEQFSSYMSSRLSHISSMTPAAPISNHYLMEVSHLGSMSGNYEDGWTSSNREEHPSFHPPPQNQYLTRNDASMVLPSSRIPKPFQPQINKNSDFLVKSRRAAGSMEPPSRPRAQPEQYSFVPSINPKSRRLGEETLGRSRGDDLYSKGMRLQRERHEWEANVREELASGCTFQPKINPMKAVQKEKKTTQHLPQSDSLSLADLLSQADENSEGMSSLLAGCSFEYRQQEWARARQERLDNAKRERERKDMEESALHCTFRPDVSARSPKRPVKPKTEVKGMDKFLNRQKKAHEEKVDNERRKQPSRGEQWQPGVTIPEPFNIGDTSESRISRKKPVSRTKLSRMLDPDAPAPYNPAFDEVEAQSAYDQRSVDGLPEYHHHETHSTISSLHSLANSMEHLPHDDLTHSANASTTGGYYDSQPVSPDSNDGSVSRLSIPEEDLGEHGLIFGLSVPEEDEEGEEGLVI